MRETNEFVHNQMLTGISGYEPRLKMTNIPQMENKPITCYSVYYYDILQSLPSVIVDKAHVKQKLIRPHA